MKTLLAGILIASTAALAIPSPASAIGIVVGPRGGVGVRVGRPVYRRPFVRPFVRGGFRRPLVRRGYHRF